MRGWLAALSAVLGTVLAVLGGLAAGPGSASSDDSLSSFRRPVTLPLRADERPTPAQAALGARLFHDRRLSGEDNVACADCHDPARNFQDDRPRGQGAHGKDLPRRTPSLYDVAWAPALFWDGRATTLEGQAIGPIASMDEMGQRLADLPAKLQSDSNMAADFATAFPERPRSDLSTIVRALAAFQRGLTSPGMAFDRFVAGDPAALSPAARRGFGLFAGKAGCAACHGGWRLTDDSFHDIGLTGADLGRGPVVGEPMLNRAFKTPSLRLVGARRYFMHDGRFDSLDQVLDHYLGHRFDPRPTLAPELAGIGSLTDAERQDLRNFLMSLTADGPPPSLTFADLTTAMPQPVRRVSLIDRQARPAAIQIKAGEVLEVVNDDTTPHALRSYLGIFRFRGGWQRPGETIRVVPPEPGDYVLDCSVHPGMRIEIDVVPR